MSQRLEALAVRKYTVGGEERSGWTKIGSAFLNRDGSYTVNLHCMPAPDRETGEYRIQLREPLPPKEEKF